MAAPERMRAAHAALVLKLGLPAGASRELQFAAHLKHALVELGPRIKSAIRRCDGVVVAGRRFVELMQGMHMYARDVANVVSGAELGGAEFVALAVRALVPAGVDAVLPRVLFAKGGGEEMAAAYRLLREESPALLDDACLLALVGGTPVAAAFLEAGGDEALARLAAVRRGGSTALELLLDALQFGSFFHCGAVACKHAAELAGAWERALPAGAEADVHRSIHRLARSGGIVGDAGWRALCKKAALEHEARGAPCWATEAGCRHAAAFWTEMHSAAVSVLTLGRHAAARRQRRAALFTWFFSRNTLYMHARALLRPAEGEDPLRWVLSAALEAEASMRAALSAAGELPGGGPRSSLESLQCIHSSDTRFDVPALHGDAATACVAAAVKDAERGRGPDFFCGVGCPRRAVVSAIVTF